MLNEWLGRVATNRWVGFLLGALNTVMPQSSSATSTTVTLIDAGAMTSTIGLGVLLGPNLGNRSLSRSSSVMRGRR